MAPDMTQDAKALAALFFRILTHSDPNKYHISDLVCKFIRWPVVLDPWHTQTQVGDPPPRYPSGGGGPSGPWFRRPTLAPHPKALGVEARPGGFSKARRGVQGDPAGVWDPYFSPGGVVWGVALHSPPWLFDPGFGPHPRPPPCTFGASRHTRGGFRRPGGLY